MPKKITPENKIIKLPWADKEPALLTKLREVCAGFTDVEGGLIILKTKTGFLISSTLSDADSTQALNTGIYYVEKFKMEKK